MNTTLTPTGPALLDQGDAPTNVPLLVEVDENTHRTPRREPGPVFRGFWSADPKELLGFSGASLRLWSPAPPADIELPEVSTFVKDLLRAKVANVEALAAQPIVDSDVAKALRARLPELVTVRLIGSYLRQIHEGITQVDRFVAEGRDDWAIQRTRSVIRLTEAVFVAATEKRVIAQPSPEVADRIASVEPNSIDTDRLTNEATRIEYSIAEHTDRLPEAAGADTFERIVIDHRVALLCGDGC